MNSKIINCYLSATDGTPKWALKIGSAIFKNDVREEKTTLGLVESISASYSEILNSSGVETSQISKFYFILGPGSFTSLRTAYSFLQGLSAPYGTSVIGLSSFLACLLSMPYRGLSQINLSLNANREEDFLAEFNIVTETLIEAKLPTSIIKGSRIDLTQIPESVSVDSLIEAVDQLGVLPQSTLNNLKAVGHLYSGEGLCDLLYIKGVSAKTLMERGII